MLSQGMPAWKSRNRALSWRETPNNALHRSWHTELDDNMKEHLNRTACGFFNSNCSTPSRQQQCSRWPHYVLLSFSTSLDEPSRKTFSSLKNARVWQLHCKEASSGRQPAEQLRKEGAQQWHVHVSIHRDLLGHNLHYKWRLNQSHFCLKRGPSAPLQQHMGKHSNPLLPLHQPCCSRTPVTLLLGAVRIASAPHFSKSRERKARLHILKRSVIHNSSSHFPPRERQSFLADKQPSACARQALIILPGKLWAAALHWPCSHAVPVLQLWVSLGGRGGSSPAFDALSHPSYPSYNPARQTFCPAPRNCTRQNSLWKWLQ